MKGERIWHYLTLLLGQRAAKALLAEQLKKLLLVALLIKYLLAVLPTR